MNSRCLVPDVKPDETNEEYRHGDGVRVADDLLFWEPFAS
jgi:hypothetical protein